VIRKHSLVVTMVIAAWIAALGFTAVARAHQDDAPSASRIAFAKQVSDLMLNELVAALFKEFDETTGQNVPHGKQAISLIFNDLNRDMRLISELSPLQLSHIPTMSAASKRKGPRAKRCRGV